MEKVQFQLESTLPELKDLYDKGLFSKHEINEITKRRTAFETALIRRVTRKEDFFKYAEYEINLERLRKVRWKKLKYHINRPPPSASTYSIPRRTLYILKRATSKFPGDLAVWLAYVEFAAREGMTKVVAKGLNSALQHHPLSPTLYLLLSYHHLHPGAPLPRSAIPSTSKLDLPSADEADSSAFSLEGTGPARTTLLLGLRLLPRSHTLWREYVKLELGWVEALRRRWRTLGIDNPAGEDKFEGDAAALAGGDGAFGPEGEDARRAILSGQLVVHALESGLGKVTPESREREDEGESADGMAFRDSLLALLRSYPSPLRTKALGIVYADLERISALGGLDGARARLALIARPLYDREYEAGRVEDGSVVLTGVELVDALGTIGREIRSIAKKSGSADWANVAGEWLAGRIQDASDNTDLQRYLLSTMTSLAKPNLSPSATLLAKHLDLVQRLDTPAYLGTVRLHAGQQPTDPAIQLLRVAAEIDAAEAEVVDIRKTAAEAAARITVAGLSAEAQELTVALWRTWAEWEDAQPSPQAAWKRLMRDSLRLGAPIPALHSTLLALYFASQMRAGVSAPAALDAIAKAYQPTSTFFISAFDELDELNGTQASLAKLYGSWRAACRTASERVTAVLMWAEWLLDQNKGRDAYDAVDVVRRELREDEAALEELELGWKSLVDEAEDRATRGDVNDEDTVMGSEEDEEDEAIVVEELDDDDDDDESGDLEIEL